MASFQATMSLTPGTRLGHYNVTALLGEGGMGQVWQATDTQLNREVALKILPDAFATDPDRLARFRREAQILASLNHPNIAAIYGIEEAEGTRALVLELVEGPTLADRISKGPIPVDEALPIAKQIAEALEAAHEAGVIHRDLKPANVKVKADGTVKVLDFGLAKALDPTPDVDPSQSPTLTAAATQMGVVLGTAAYMSPEQASGETVDKRSDIWSFGVVLFEMLTARRLFEGKTVAHVMSAVIQVDPKWDALPTATPQPMLRLLRRCLAKDRQRRLRDIGDALTDLDEALIAPPADETAHAPPAQPAGWRQALPLALGISTVSVLITTLAVWAMMRPDPAGLVRFEMVPPDTARLRMGPGSRDLAVSSDGTQVVYTSFSSDGGRQLTLRPIDQFAEAPLSGGEEGRSPFFSPDGEWVGFVALGGGRTLQKVSIFGGPPVTLTEAPSGILGASWGIDDQIIFGTFNSGLFRVSGGGGEPEALTTPDTEQLEAHRWPSIIPGREAVVFAVGSSGPTNFDFLPSAQLAVLDLGTGEVTPLGLAGASPHYVPTGHLVFAAEDDSVRAVPFDATSLEVTGSPVPLVEGVSVGGDGAAHFSISENGRLVYVLDVVGNLQSRLVLTGREGAGTVLADIDGLAWYPRFSPDGRRVAFAVAQAERPGTDADLWVLDIERDTRTRITFGGTNHRFFPVWSPDGTRLAYAEGSGRTNRVLVTSADGSGETETLIDRDERQFPMSWSPDGSARALYQGGAGGSSRDLIILPMDGDDRTPVPFLSTPFQERGVSFSLNGRWLAYVSDESGQDEIYVRPYPGPGGEEIVSSGGGEEAVWGPDGSELFYRSGDQLMVVPVSTGETWSAEAPLPLFAAPYVLDNSAGGGGSPNYDISPDGEQFIFVESDSSGVSPHISVVLNWFEELKERVPVP